MGGSLAVEKKNELAVGVYFKFFFFMEIDVDLKY